MPVKIPNDLPVKEILEKENIFVMDESRANSQDIRPIQICILNLMPLKEDTELQILRALSNTPLQIDVTFMRTDSHESTHTSKSHLDTFYETFDSVKKRCFDGMIITGAPVEMMEYEEVDYWPELTQIFEWCNTHVTSTLFLCWATQAAMYYYYGIQKKILDTKLFGIFQHRLYNRKTPLVRGIDDVFMMPHSRHTAVMTEDILNCGEITVLAESVETGVSISMAQNGRRIFIMGHPEYGRNTLRKEYERDLGKRSDVSLPKNYFPNDDPNEKPLLTWRGTANILYTNWLNYYVYQSTPYALGGTPWGEELPDNFQS